ncbi:MAG: Nramp family divalent metal transporter [Saprospiraceae bacterium]|nr:Nramp family divalent metal transporter [Saprospiraceae bacterium]
MLRKLGPGIITAALVFGPGSLTITTKLGSEFGNAMLWVIIVAVIFMISYTNMAARIGMSSKDTLMQLVRMHWGKILTMALGIGIFLISSSFQAGNSIGAGLAFAELTGTSIAPWVLFFSGSAIVLLFFRSFYRILEKLMIGLVLIMLASFLLTIIMSRPNFAAILKGLVPSVPEGSLFLSIAIMASSFSVVGAFYQSYLVQEKGWLSSNAKSAVRESTSGIIILGLLSSMVLLCASAVLYQQAIPVNTASDLGLALQPLFGNFTSIAFMVGFFAASFSSLIGNATIGGALLADAFGLGQQLSSQSVRRLIALVIIAGAAIALQFGSLPLQLIIFAQAITIVIAPLAALAILMIANKQSIMGNLTNTRKQNVLPVIGLITLIILAIYNMKTIFFS